MKSKPDHAKVLSLLWNPSENWSRIISEGIFFPVNSLYLITDITGLMFSDFKDMIPAMGNTSSSNCSTTCDWFSIVTLLCDGLR